MRDMFRMIVVLSVLCGLSGFALSYLKMITAPRIEEQVLANVQGPAIKRVFPYAENDPIGERKRFEADGRAFMIFPVRSGGALVGVAEGLQRYPQLHAALAVDVDELVVLQLDDVAVLLGDDAGHVQQLTGPVRQMDGEGEHPAPVDEAVLHQGGDGDHIHIAAA